MDITAEIKLQKDSFDLVVILKSNKISLFCIVNLINNNKSLEIYFPGIQGLSRCSFTMDNEDIDTLLLSKSRVPIADRLSANAIGNRNDGYRISLKNAVVFLQPTEAVEFYEIVDRLDEEIGRLLSVKKTS